MAWVTSWQKICCRLRLSRQEDFLNQICKQIIQRIFCYRAWTKIEFWLCWWSIYLYHKTLRVWGPKPHIRKMKRNYLISRKINQKQCKLCSSCEINDQMITKCASIYYMLKKVLFHSYIVSAYLKDKYKLSEVLHQNA